MRIAVESSDVTEKDVLQPHVFVTCATKKVAQNVSTFVINASVLFAVHVIEL